MLSTRIRSLQEAVLDRPRAVLVLVALLTVAALFAAMQVELRTSRRDMVAPGDPDQARYDAIRADFTGPDPLILGLEFAAGPSSSGPPADASASSSDSGDQVASVLAPDESDELRALADRIASQLEQSPSVDSVFYKIDTDWLAQNFIHLAPPEQIGPMLDGIARMLPGDARELTGWVDINETLARNIRDNLDDPEAMGGSQQPGQGLSSIATLIDAQRRFLEDPTGFASDLDPDLLKLLGGADPRLASGGYLTTYDGSLFFMLVSPAVSLDETLASNLQLVQAVDQIVQTELDGHRGRFRVSSTGNPALIVEEMQSIKSDTIRSSFVASIGVTILALLAFRWRGHALIALVALAFGVIWAFGAVELEIGYLNVITSSFVSTLIGVGIAYAIHPISEYEVEGAHIDDPRRSVLNAYRRTGAAVLVSGVTTAGAFFAILLMDFQGFAELGLIAGIGVLLCLLSALVFLPVLLAWYGKRRHARGDRGARTARAAAVDCLWVDRFAGLVCRWPVPTTVLALVVTGGFAVAASGVAMSTDILDLLPQGAESKRLFQRMTSESNLTPRVNLIVTPSLDELRAMQERATTRDEIARMESILNLLPSDSEQTGDSAEKLNQLLERVVIANSPTTDPMRRIASLEALEAALSEAVDAAFVAGQAEIVDGLDQAREKAEQTLEFARGAADSSAQAWSEGEAQMLARVRGWRAQLQQAARQPRPTLETLPESIRRRLITRSGNLIGLLYPSGNIFEPEFLRAFNEASKQVSPEATGFPVMFEKVSTRITDGFVVALIAGALIVFFVLLIDMRSLFYAVLAMIPLGLGVVWMLGGMRLLGIDFNLANLVALPLVLGVGIDNGVHVVHRVRLEGKEGMATVIRHTGRAIVIASLTTMIGFGSLALASHRGLASLGLILLVGVGACLITSLIVLPNALLALRWSRR